MKNLTYSIQQQIFKDFPSFKRGVIVCKNIDNSINGIPFSYELKTGINLDNLTEHEHILEWRKAFRYMGIDPTKHRPSAEGLTRRVLKGQSIRSINPLVDLCNILSVQKLIPVGAHPLDELSENISLQKAKGHEKFVGFGKNITHEDIENIPNNEIILISGQVVLTRRWVWRQSSYSCISPQTKAAFINIDFLEEKKEYEIRTTCEEIAAVIQKILFAEIVKISVLSSSQPEFSFSI